MRNRTRVGRTLLAVCLAAALTVALAACGRGQTPTSSQGAGSSGALPFQFSLPGEKRFAFFAPRGRRPFFSRCQIGPVPL